MHFCLIHCIIGKCAMRICTKVWANTWNYWFFYAYFCTCLKWMISSLNKSCATHFRYISGSISRFPPLLDSNCDKVHWQSCIEASRKHIFYCFFCVKSYGHIDITNATFKQVTNLFQCTKVKDTTCILTICSLYLWNCVEIIISNCFLVDF